jgi:hypothetical protein
MRFPIGERMPLPESRSSEIFLLLARKSTRPILLFRKGARFRVIIPTLILWANSCTPRVERIKASLSFARGKKADRMCGDEGKADNAEIQSGSFTAETLAFLLRNPPAKLTQWSGNGHCLPLKRTAKSRCSERVTITWICLRKKSWSWVPCPCQARSKSQKTRNLPFLNVLLSHDISE